MILTHFFRPNVGGVETHLDDLVNYLVGTGYDVNVLTYQPLVTNARAPVFERKENLTIWRAPWPGWGLFNVLEPHPVLQFLYLTPGLLMWSFVFMVLNSRSIHVIHAHGLVPAFIGRLLKAIWHKRLVVSIHAVYGWLYDLKQNSLGGRVIRDILFGADAILALAERSREELISLGIPADKISVFTYWVDQRVFCPRSHQESRARLGWNDDFVVLFAGRLIPVKGIETLVDVAKMLPQMRFVFVGDGPLREFLIQAAEKQGNIFFAGRLANSELPVYYSAADILCVPSQYEEGFGRVILEALSCGCPVVGAKKGGIPETMDDSVGILVEPTAAQLVDALEHLWRQPHMLEKLRRNCRPYAERRFGLHNAQIIEKSYHA